MKKILTLLIGVSVLISTLTACATHDNSEAVSENICQCKGDEQLISEAVVENVCQCKENEQLTSSHSIAVQLIECEHFRRTAWYYMDYTIQQVSDEEYAENSEKVATKYFTDGMIYADGRVDCNRSTSDASYASATASFEELEESVGKTYYVYAHVDNSAMRVPSKITYNELVLSYINVTFYDDGSIEISYYKNSDKEIAKHRIKADYYLTYFVEK